MSYAFQALLSRRGLNKMAFVPMTDPAMQAGMGGGAPMDPYMGGGMPPQGAPMGGGMPPQGVPMGGASMPQGGTGDPIMDQLMAMGYQIDQQGNVYDQNGQPVPPEQLQQLAQQIAAQMGPQGGAPMDPSMGGQPMDPSMGGAPMDPATQPSEADPMAMMAEMINTIIDERMSNLDKRIAAINDKLDTLRSLMEDLMESKEAKESGAMANEADKEITNILSNAGASDEVPSPQMIAPAVPQGAADQMDLLAALGGQQ